MRYTLSVLTAACVLALSQPAWSETIDRELLQRARNAALALPDRDRASASQWLQQLQTAAPATAAVAKRPLPFHPVFQAIGHTLAQCYATTSSAHVLAHPVVPASWRQALVAAGTQHRHLQLDANMVQRWITPWQQETA